MSKKVDVRWHQRFQNFQAAFQQLERAVKLEAQRDLSELEKQGLIQAFEFTHELAWNVLKDYFSHQGAAELITGSRDATREAFNKGIIDSGDVWMEMILSRNLTSHTYNEEVADQIIEKITEEYFPAFSAFRDKMTQLRDR